MTAKEKSRIQEGKLGELVELMHLQDSSILLWS